MQRLWSIISIYSIFTHIVIVIIYRLSARSEGIAFWCFGELETYWTEWFIDVHWLFCRDCNELHVLFRMHYRRNCIFLAPPWFRTSPNKSWISRPSKSRSIFEFRLFVHWCIGLWCVFYSILEVSDAALPPETRQNGFPTVLNFNKSLSRHLKNQTILVITSIISIQDMCRRKTLPTSTSMTSSNNTPRALSRCTNLKICFAGRKAISNTMSMYLDRSRRYDIGILYKKFRIWKME